MFGHFRKLREKHGHVTPIAFFLLGFGFDALVLGRIDHFLTLAQQGVYLGLAGLLISLEYIEYQGWPADKYREPILHFILGTLLNGYAIFYFKSASSMVALLYLAVLVAILLVNEFKEFKKFGVSQTVIHLPLFALCLVSYFVYLVPIILGFIGVVPFMGALAVSALAFMPMFLFLKKRLTLEVLQRKVMLPFLLVQLLFALLYFGQLIPPVPLSVSYIGIYHDIKRVNGDFRLSYTRPAWKFWQHGDQTFYARPKDKIYCFARIFSPTRFKDELQIRWLYHEPRQGWLSSDAIPIQISGGREEGYRGVTQKSNFQPGKWRVQVETTDNREVGRIRFNVIADASLEEREFKMEIQ